MGTRCGAKRFIELSRGVMVGLALLVITTNGMAAQPLFESHERLALEVTAPHSKLRREKTNDSREEVEGSVSFTDANGETKTFPIKVSTRGNFRRRECRYPPIRLNFRKGDLAGTVFEGQDKLKLVAPCDRSGRYEQFVINEYLIYRIYNLVTDYSFRVRPVDVTFTESSGRGSSLERFGFLIEDDKALAKRHGKKVAEWPELRFSQYVASDLALYEIFQFMIGGHDWSVLVGEPDERCCHNGRVLIDKGATDGAIPIPYDFDLTGLVNAPYAQPPAEIPIRSVRKRYFRGRCKTEQVWAQTFAHFQSLREPILALYDESSPLDAKQSRSATKYLRAFYELLEDPAKLEKAVTGKCRGKPPA